MEQEEKLKRSREPREIKTEQEKSEKGARGKKLKGHEGAGSKGENCERSKEHESSPPPNGGSVKQDFLKKNIE